MEKVQGYSRKLTFIIISIIFMVLLFLLFPIDYFSHGFYSDAIEYYNISEEDIWGYFDLGQSSYDLTFTPLQDHFAGFEVMLDQIPEDVSGELELVTSADGSIIETWEVNLSDVSSKNWYMIYADEKYKKNIEYQLKISVRDCNEAPLLLMIDNDYLQKESQGDNLLIGYAYEQSTFTLEEKALILLLALSIWLFLLGEMWISDMLKRKYVRVGALTLGLTVLLSWNYMFNSFDVENDSNFETFQLDSDALVLGVIEAEKDDANIIDYGLGRYFVAAGPYSSQISFRDDDNWEKGYSKNEPQICISNNLYTREFIAPGIVIQFANEDLFIIQEVVEEEENYILTLNTDKPLNYYKYGDLQEASFYYSDEGTLNRYPNGLLTSYKSQYGLQGRIFQLMVQVLGIDRYEEFLELLCSVAAAFIFSLLIVLVGLKYNLLYGACFAVTFLLSPWVVNFASSEYWVEFTWFLPMLIGLVCSIWVDIKWIRIISYVGAFLSIAVKSLCGYEYISTVMLGLVAFPVIDWIGAMFKRDKKRTLLLFKTIFIMGMLALAGFGIAICMHAFIRGEGSIWQGIQKIVAEDVLRRVGGGNLNDFEPIYWSSLNASAWETLRKYFHFETDVLAAIDATQFPVLCLLPIVIFIYDYVKNQLITEDIIMYIVFFLTAISWFVLGKSHSYIHTFMNYVLWYFGFVQCCLYIILKKIFLKINGKVNV